MIVAVIQYGWIDYPNLVSQAASHCTSKLGFLLSSVHLVICILRLWWVKSDFGWKATPYLENVKYQKFCVALFFSCVHWSSNLTVMSKLTIVTSLNQHMNLLPSEFHCLLVYCYHWLFFTHLHSAGCTLGSSLSRSYSHIFWGSHILRNCVMFSWIWIKNYRSNFEQDQYIYRSSKI